MSIDSSFAVSEARRQLARDHRPGPRRTRNRSTSLARSRRVAAVIDADDLDELLQLAEDMSDIRGAEAEREVMRATGTSPIPWEQVKADLRLA